MALSDNFPPSLLRKTRPLEFYNGEKTYILVADKIFEIWLMAPPARLILDDQLALVLSLTVASVGLCLTRFFWCSRNVLLYPALDTRGRKFSGVKIQ